MYSLAERPLSETIAVMAASGQNRLRSPELPLEPALVERGSSYWEFKNERLDHVLRPLKLPSSCLQSGGQAVSRTGS
jgi:hypothetical protein